MALHAGNYRTLDELLDVISNTREVQLAVERCLVRLKAAGPDEGGAEPDRLLRILLQKHARN
jgi:hypothetical protein